MRFINFCPVKWDKKISTRLSIPWDCQVGRPEKHTQSPPLPFQVLVRRVNIRQNSVLRVHLLKYQF